MSKANASNLPAVEIGRKGFVQAFRVAARQYTRLSVRTKKSARETLVREGILTPSGNLTANYR